MVKDKTLQEFVLQIHVFLQGPYLISFGYELLLLTTSSCVLCNLKRIIYFDSQLAK